jgi:hypothetical protein
MLNFLRLVSIVTVASLATMLAAPLKADVTSWKKVGGWDIGFYPNLPGCLAYMPYEGGTHFWIGFIRRDDDILLDVSLMDDAWRSIEACLTTATSGGAAWHPAAATSGAHHRGVVVGDPPWPVLRQVRPQHARDVLPCRLAHRDL